MSQQLTNKKRNPERGGYVVFLALGFFALLAIVGLAIDAAKLYRTKAELQTAVDAAAIAGGNLLVTQPNLSFSEVRSRATQIFKENLRLMKISESQITNILSDASPQSFDVCFHDPNSPQACDSDPTDPNIQRRFIQAVAAISQPTLILGLIPGFQKATLVAAQAFAESLKLQVLLVIDVSGSMNQNYSGGPQKIVALRAAAKSLVDTLLPFDELGIVTFAANLSGSELPISFTNYEPTADVTNWSNILNNYLNDAAIPLNLTQIIAAGPTDNRPLIKAQVDALNPSGGTNAGAGFRKAKTIFDSAPTPVKTLRIIVLATDGATNTGVPLTWLNVADPSVPSSLDPTSTDDRPLNRPNLPRACNSPFLPFTSSSMSNPNGLTLQRLRFLDTIIESDKARDAGYLVWSVGLGDPDPSRGSPFQNISDGDSMKLPLLTRIANDQEQMPLQSMTPGWTIPTPSPDYPWDFPCIRSGRDLRNTAKKVGKFTLATNAAALEEAFKNIATVRLKVTQ